MNNTLFTYSLLLGFIEGLEELEKEAAFAGLSKLTGTLGRFGRKAEEATVKAVKASGRGIGTSVGTMAPKGIKAPGLPSARYVTPAEQAIKKMKQGKSIGRNITVGMGNA